MKFKTMEKILNLALRKKGLSVYAFIICIFMLSNPVSAQPSKALGEHIPLKASSYALDFIGSAEFPTTKDNAFIGISGLDYSKKDDIFYAISDDTNYSNARFYKLKINYNDKDDRFSVQLKERVDLYTSKGDLLDEYGKVDFEAITLLPGGSLLISSEEDYTTAEVFPSFWEFNKKGKFKYDFNLPSRFNNDMKKHLNKTGKKTFRGCSYNGAFESLITLASSTVSNVMLAGLTEHPLLQDQKTGCSRFSIFKKGRKSLDLTAEYAYPVSLLEKSLVKGAKKINTGVSDILEMGPNSYLSIERSYVLYKGKKDPLSVIRIYHFWMDSDTTNIVSQDKMDDDVVPLRKELVLDLLDVRGDNGQKYNIYNFEAFERGPKYKGKDTIVLVNDNGDNIDLSTQFLFFALNEHRLN